MRAHGTRACYVHGPFPGSTPGGCRCGPCRRASSEAQREARSEITPPYVDATEVREHLAMLSAAGVGLKQVTRLTGVSGGALTKIVYGTPRKDGTLRPPARRVRPETRNRILAVMPSHAADGAKVDAKRTLATVETLVARGWTKAEISRRIGQTTGGLQLGSESVTAGHARTIRSLLDEPVPPRRSRHGLHPVPQPVEDDPREVARRAAEAERRATYRAAGRTDSGPVLDLAEVAWMADGACREPDVPTWLFFPTAQDHKTVSAAKRVCEGCPVRAECLSYATERGEEGVWGGTSEVDRIMQAMEAAS